VTSFDRTAALAKTYIDGVEVDSRSIEGLGNLDTGYPGVHRTGPGGCLCPKRNLHDR
jgi:hypothetical protein